MVSATQRTKAALVSRLLDRIGLGRLRRDPQAMASAKLARDLALPADQVADILDRTQSDLRKLSGATDQDSIDARPIIDRAVHDLAQLGARPFDKAIMDGYLQELPDRDYQILRYFKQGLKQSEIAELMGMNVDLVRHSLVNTYAELRLRVFN